MILDKYKYLLFDLDDTLLDFGKAQVLAFKKLLEDTFSMVEVVSKNKGYYILKAVK